MCDEWENKEIRIFKRNHHQVVHLLASILFSFLLSSFLFFVTEIKSNSNLHLRCLLTSLRSKLWFVWTRCEGRLRNGKSGSTTGVSKFTLMILRPIAQWWGSSWMSDVTCCCTILKNPSSTIDVLRSLPEIPTKVIQLSNQQENLRNLIRVQQSTISWVWRAQTFSFSLSAVLPRSHSNRWLIPMVENENITRLRLYWSWKPSPSRWSFVFGDSHEFSVIFFFSSSNSVKNFGRVDRGGRAVQQRRRKT